MKTSRCEDCTHFNDEEVPGEKVCHKNHKPRWYAPKKGKLHEYSYGYKRKCADFSVLKKP